MVHAEVASGLKRCPVFERMPGWRATTSAGPGPNMIAHLLDSVPYHEVPPAVLGLPERPPSADYQRPPRNPRTYVPYHAAGL
ncbi:hypothetical protein SGFS_100910 [Streptomyces graminofaciens]|uniref:Uncharacterized protein n=1 Tax=Streptomyces graminofaciens TaxID=68212 RepID=A0ABN5VZY0_9ACTN|nr:hypothetical protein SGFS_100910 [Streptomyces graminofaciens]